MTAEQQTPLPPTTPLTAEPNSRLEALTASYDRAKTARDQAEKELKEITEAIKHEARTAAPDSTDIVIRSPFLMTPLHLLEVKSMRLDTKRMQAEQPLLFSQLSKATFSWKLERLR